MARKPTAPAAAPAPRIVEARNVAPRVVATQPADAQLAARETAAATVAVPEIVTPTIVAPAPVPPAPQIETSGEAQAEPKQNAAGPLAGPQPAQTEVMKNMDKAVKSAEELVTFSQGNFEAMMKAGQIWAAGVQDLQKAAAATAQAQMEAAMGTFKALSSVKSLKEAMDLQATLARSSLEAAVNETGKLTDASMKLAEQAMAPITARVTLAVEKFGRVA